MNAELQSILGSGIELSLGVIVPVDHIEYRGKSRRYVVWTIIDEQLALAADDEALYDEVKVDIDIYSYNDYTDIISAIKALMKKNEWTLCDTSPEMFDDSTRLNHRTLTFAKERYNNGI